LALQGNLEDFDLTDVLQLIHLGKKNGALEIETEGNRGEIYFENGKVVYAKTKETSGEESIHYILRWSKGKFLFSPEKKAPEKRMDIPIQNLILDAAKQIDEWKRLEKVIPSVEMIVDFVEDPEVSSEEINLSPDEWKILSLITGEKSIREIAQLSKMTEFNTAKIFYGLISSGLVQLKKPLKKEEKKVEVKKEEKKKENKKKRGFFRRG
jgi:predicted transcriptional regulator